MAAKTKPDEIRLKKETIVELYKKTFGNITKCCEAIKISRTTFYEWYNSDPAFKAELEAISPDDLICDLIS